MDEINDHNPRKIHLPANKTDLRTKYNALLAYINTVVVFRFTTLSLYLAAVAFILANKPTFGKYLLLILISISFFLLEIRNRFLKNDLEYSAKQIEIKWGYYEKKREDYKRLALTSILLLVINKKEDISENDPRICKKILGISILNPMPTHSLALDILYFSIFFYALLNVIAISIPYVVCFLFTMSGAFR